MARIIINPQVFKDSRDAMCVAFDEAFRIVMEMNGFDPVSGPTERQRKFFSDTEYANDERMLRRTILARICTFDTSVSDPTDEQLQEAVEFLDTVMEIGAPQNEWEQRSVQRIRDAIARTVGQPRAPEETPEPPAEGPSNAAIGGGDSRLVRAAIDTQDEEKAERQSDQDPGAGIASDFQNSIDEQVKQDLADAGVQPGQTMPEANEAAQDKMAVDGSADTSHIKYGPQPGKTPTMADVGKAVAEAKRPDVVIPDDNAPGGRIAQSGQNPQGQTAGGKVDAAGRQLDDRGRVMAGETPTKRQGTGTEQKWAEARAESTADYLARKEAREERRRANNADRIADRNELLEKARAGKFGDRESTIAALFGNSDFNFDFNPTGMHTEAPSTGKMSTISQTGLASSGTRGNIFTYNGRRISAREYERRKALGNV